MRITSLKLRGFIGIKKGLGMDEISLDFSQLSGLIAISGENGAGKSSLIDNLSPYRQLASRAGALQRHVFLRDSIKELCFEFAGDIYRTLIKIDSDSDRTEGFIWKNDVPQVSGKVSAYDKYIIDLFGSAQLFFSSVFCAQNAEKISDMTTSELKKLFSEFLRLDRLVEYENTAKQCVALLTAKAEGLAKDIQAAKDSLSGTEELEAKLASVEATLKESQLLVKTLAADLKDSEAELEAARTLAANNTAIRQRIQDLESSAAKIGEEIAADTAASEAELLGLREKVRGIRAEIAAAEKVLESKDAVAEAVSRLARLEAAMAANTAALAAVNGEVSSIDTQIRIAVFAKTELEDRLAADTAAAKKELSSLSDAAAAVIAEIEEKEQFLKGKDRIDAAIKKVEEIKAAMSANSEKLAGVQGQIAPLNNSAIAISSELAEAKSSLSGIISDPSVRLLESKIKGRHEKMADLDKKDPACTSTTCSFIVGALAAKADLTTLEPKLEALKAEVVANMKSAQALIDKKAAELSEIKNQIDEAVALRKSAEAESFRLQADLNGFQVAADEQPKIAIAEARLSDLVQRKSEIKQRADAIDNELSAKTMLAQIAINTKSSGIDALEGQINELVKNRQDVEAEAARIRLNLESTREIAANQSKVAVAEARLSDLLKQEDEACRDGKRVRDTWDERIGKKRAESADLAYRIKDVENLIDPFADNKMADVQSIIASHRLHLDDETAGMARQEAQIAALKKGLDAKAETESRIGALILGYDIAVNETADWLYLKNACSKDGLRALEIDSVAPIISGYANDLLVDTFGPQYTVKLRTQDENGKEVLDILTIREDGSEVNIENLSGGERVWSLKAMRLAMTLISKEKSAKAFTSFFADEEDGSLDPENAQNFIGLYRSFMKSGGFDTGFFISHKPECVAMADHVLRFGKSGVVIE